VILVIDTSSAIAAIATLNGDRNETFVSARTGELQSTLRRIARDKDVTKVAVVTGPGSFTGLRVGVSFALGLAMGRRIPIVPLPTLELQAARSDDQVTAVADAGRGRFYFRLPDGTSGVAAPAEISTQFPLVGRLAARETLAAAGHRFKPEEELRRLVDAAAILLETAHEVPYRNLEIEYMQTFARKR
jgi:tRNA threonylcarbamoyl adenosine modification protein YeaZ